MKKEILELCHKVIILNGEVSQAECSYIKCENCPFSEQISGIHISCNNLLPYHALDIARHYIAEHEAKEQNIKSTINIVKDNVNNPSHYNTGTIEVIEVIEDWKLNFNLGNAIKYIGRCEHKNNKHEDIKKAIWYLERELNNDK